MQERIDVLLYSASHLGFLAASATGFPIGPYAFPTDGKQPVILGPSGTPVYPNYNASQGAPADGGTGAAAHYSEGLTAPDGSHFEYSDPV